MGIAIATIRMNRILKIMVSSRAFPLEGAGSEEKGSASCAYEI